MLCLTIVQAALPFVLACAAKFDHSLDRPSPHAPMPPASSSKRDNAKNLVLEDTESEHDPVDDPEPPPAARSPSSASTFAAAPARASDPTPTLADAVQRSLDLTTALCTIDTNSDAGKAKVERALEALRKVRGLEGMLRERGK